MLNRLIISELKPELEFGDYDSYYLTWYDSSYGGDGPYGQPFSSSQERPYDNYNSSIHEEADDGMELPYSGDGNMLGGKEDSHCQAEENLDSYYTSNDMQLGYGDDQWSSYGGFSFRVGGMEDFHDHDSQELPYNNSWNDSNEIIPYERIFGY
ncbi:Hypothetical predicted protein [Olea europaea subsp. europaea]|uniref:Uncharacterized protein n=1 Tax=Olea europaea subsp. europaea TaxID=158383 RepID=A0A8S0ULC1_OLEEU|nr:Hypothetical predicted protein [Olea europaea subsp. europaea]